MTKKNIIVGAGLIALMATIGYFSFIYRPDWHIEKVVREGELLGKAIQTVVAERGFRDFKFSDLMNGMTAHITDLPANTVILTLHASLGEVFEGKNGEAPSLQVMIQNDDGTACTMDINNIVDGEPQSLAAGRLCATGEKGTLFIRDASAMRAFKSGEIKVLLSYITL